jgi:hypothetical protein
MSQGPGSLQRRILAALGGQAMTCPRLARYLHGAQPTPTQQAAVRRAVRRLAEMDRLRRVHPIQAQEKDRNDKWCDGWASVDLAARLRSEWDAEAAQMMTRVAQIRRGSS